MPYTSDKKPGALTAATVLADSDNVVVEQSGDVKKATLTQVEAKIFASKTALTTPGGTEVTIVRQTDGNLRQVPLANIVPALNITDAKVSESAGIVDTKLATINTAGKVTNNAVQATDANTANRIVARDGSGNFAAGTITATLSGNASTATVASGVVDASISTAKIADSAVTSAKIADSAVTSAKIADSAVASAKIADSAVTSAKILDGTIVDADINASAAIAGTKISPNFGSQNVVTTGSVGIGTSSPSTKLQVSGTVTATAFSGPLTGTASDVANGAVTAAKLNGGQTGSAPIFGCRAWVNFDGTKNTSGTVIADNTNRFIRASGNVSSVLRNGAGDYTITFATALPITDYCVFGAGLEDNGSLQPVHTTAISLRTNADMLTTSVRILNSNIHTGTPVNYLSDGQVVTVSVIC
jgi:hypothetical protein